MAVLNNTRGGGLCQKRPGFVLLDKHLYPPLKGVYKRGGSIAKEPVYEIQNVVASVTLNQRLDLEKIAEKVPHAEYSPEHPGSPDPGSESSPGSSSGLSGPRLPR